MYPTGVSPSTEEASCKDIIALNPHISSAPLARPSLYESTEEYQCLSSSTWEEVSKGIGSIIEDKDMFLTAQGYLGLGHEGFQVGDTVCILSGGDVPFLLREHAQEDQKVFLFLSEC